jgi:hypothetical protein
LRLPALGYFQPQPDGPDYSGFGKSLPGYKKEHLSLPEKNKKRLFALIGFLAV